MEAFYFWKAAKDALIVFNSLSRQNNYWETMSFSCNFKPRKFLVCIIWDFVIIRWDDGILWPPN